MMADDSYKTLSNPSDDTEDSATAADTTNTNSNALKTVCSYREGKNEIVYRCFVVVSSLCYYSDSLQ